MGVFGEGPNAIHWATPAYLQRVNAEFAKEYQKRKDQMGNRPFFIGDSAEERLLRLVKKEQERRKEEEERVAEERRQKIANRHQRRRDGDEVTVMSDVYSLYRINRSDSKAVLRVPVRHCSDYGFSGGPEPLPRVNRNGGSERICPD